MTDNNNTNSKEKTIPKGLALLKGPKRSYKFTVAYLDMCCESYPNGCGFEDECHQWYSTRCNVRAVDGGWGFPRRYKEPPEKRQTEVQRYANSLPTLCRRMVISTIRERPIY